MRLTLAGLKPDVEAGFEGLVRRLFEAEMGMSFYLARKGDQPSGDAYSPRAGVVLEAKCYTTGRVSEQGIEGEIDDALRRVPDLDLFVITSTKHFGQLAARLKRKTQELGIDVLMLSLSDQLTEFGALCIAHWDVVRGAIPKFGTPWHDWAASRSSESETRAALERLRQDLHGFLTRVFVAEKCGTKLDERFCGKGPGAQTHNRILIQEAVDRPTVEKNLMAWWEAKESSVAVLEGANGMGKTWAAAAFVSRLRAADSPVVFWLDSLVWGEIGRIEDLVTAALEVVFIGDKPFRARIQRKIFRCWNAPVLLVLDGANERSAWKAAERLLRDYQAHQDELHDKLRLLFTSRPLEPRTGRISFWNGCRVIPVGRFDEREFQAAMARVAPDLATEALSLELRELALIPRYFRLSIRMRNKLASFRHVTIPMLLWEDLREKLESGDPQLASLNEELSGTPAEILAQLAKCSRWPTSGSVVVPTSELQKVFPNVLQVRADLMEQRMVLDANHEETILTRDHVILGWALFLHRTAKIWAKASPEDLPDRLAAVLEPAGADDDKVKAIHLAAFLAFLDEDADGDIMHLARAALLSLWLAHHNAVVDGEGLQFFVQKDLKGYARCVEILFQAYLPGGLETKIIAPLASIWRDRKAGVNDLQKILPQWLRLIYPGDARGSKDGNLAPPNRFKAAESPEQLRLSYAAIGIISFRPEIELIPDLFDCGMSSRYCFVDRGTGVGRLPIKSPDEQLGILLRWGFTEKIMPELQAMRVGATLGTEESEQLLWFARLLRMAALPQEIGVAQDCSLEAPMIPAADVTALSRWLQGKPEGGDEVRVFHRISHLAVRRDLPPLEEIESQALCADVSRRIDYGENSSQPRETWHNHGVFELLPWLARYAPVEFHANCHRMWGILLRSKQGIRGLLDFGEMIPALDTNGELPELLLRETGSICTQANWEAVVSPLTELMLFHGRLDQIGQWLVQLEDKVMERGGNPVIDLKPLPNAFEKLAPKELADWARERFSLAFSKWKENPGALLQKRIAQHWLQIYADVVSPNKEAGNWALSLATEMKTDEAFCFPLFRLALDSRDPEVLRNSLSHPAFRTYQVGSHVWRWRQQISLQTWPAFSFDQIKKHTSLTTSGLLLAENGMDDELRKWGATLVDQALAMLRVSSAEHQPQTAIEFHVGDQGQSNGAQIGKLEEGGSRLNGLSSPAWGIDRSWQKPALTQDDCNESIKKVRADIERLRLSPRRDFVHFNACRPMLLWSQLAPDAFESFAQEFLSLLVRSDVKDCVDLSFFAKCILVVLLRVNPGLALRFGEWKTPEMHFRVLTFDGALPWETRELWSRSLNLSLETSGLRRQLLIEAANEETLFWQVAAALDDENAAQVLRLADQWLKAPVAHLRALAVSLLAFLGDSSALAALAELKTTDPSLWVREHACWAWQVCATELACKQRYREMLQSGTLPELARGLAELRPALTPMARVWRKHLEKQVSWANQDQRLRCYLDLFWYHWSSVSTHQKDLRIFGRKLSSYCRGERLQEGVATRQAPWWRLEN